jgi:hypothetical protein
MLRQHADLTGVLLDLPPTAEVPQHVLAGQGLSHRCQVFAGDFFPVGAGGL